MHGKFHLKTDSNGVNGSKAAISFNKKLRYMLKAVLRW